MKNIKENKPLELLNVADYHCKECGNDIFYPIGKVRVIFLKGKEERKFSFEETGIKCTICGAERYSTLEGYV